MISSASELESTWPFTTLMAANEVLKFGYQLGQGLGAIGHRKAALIELPNNKGGFSLGYNPSDEDFLGFQRKEKEMHWPRDVYSPQQGQFSSSSRGHPIKNGTGIMRGGIRSSLSHLSSYEGIMALDLEYEVEVEHEYEPHVTLLSKPWYSRKAWLAHSEASSTLSL